MSNTKDKRTKEQIMKLLDHAMEQEERLGAKIKTLEEQLVHCRKRSEDTRHELTEDALPASKVSFRIDYYRTSDNTPFKGIIEHLPSRQNKAFEGEWQKTVNDFIGHFLSEETAGPKKSRPEGSEKAGATAVVRTESGGKAKAVQRLRLLEESTAGGSPLLQRLKARFAAEMQQSPGFQGKDAAKKTTSQTPVPRQATVPATKHTYTRPGTHEAGKMPVRKSGLAERLRAENWKSLRGKK